MREDFEYILYRAFKLTADGDTVRFQVEFMYRHHDRAKVEAFMRLFGRRPREE